MSEQSCEVRVSSHLESRGDDFTCFMNGETTCTPEDGGYEDSFEEFCNYGLCFDYVDSDTFEGQEEGYYRYQLSWGGPSDELRFFRDGRVEYWFMDWFDGACLTVTGKDWAQWLVEHFTDLEMINWESKDWDLSEEEY